MKDSTIIYLALILICLVCLSFSIQDDKFSCNDIITTKAILIDLVNNDYNSSEKSNQRNLILTTYMMLMEKYPDCTAGSEEADLAISEFFENAISKSNGEISIIVGGSSGGCGKCDGIMNQLKMSIANEEVTEEEVSDLIAIKKVNGINDIDTKSELFTDLILFEKLKKLNLTDYEIKFDNSELYKLNKYILSDPDKLGEIFTKPNLTESESKLKTKTIKLKVPKDSNFLSPIP